MKLGDKSAHCGALRGTLTPGSKPRSGIVSSQRGASVPGVIIFAQSGGAKVGNFHYIPCKFNRKWTRILCHREAKGTGWPPCPPCVSIPGPCP
jgi:hypothetical protein